MVLKGVFRRSNPKGQSLAIIKEEDQLDRTGSSTEASMDPVCILPAQKKAMKRDDSNDECQLSPRSVVTVVQQHQLVERQPKKGRSASNSKTMMRTPSADSAAKNKKANPAKRHPSTTQRRRSSSTITKARRSSSSNKKKTTATTSNNHRVLLHQDPAQVDVTQKIVAARLANERLETQRQYLRWQQRHSIKVLQEKQRQQRELKKRELTQRIRGVAISTGNMNGQVANSNANASNYNLLKTPPPRKLATVREEEPKSPATPSSIETDDKTVPMNNTKQQRNSAVVPEGVTMKNRASYTRKSMNNPKPVENPEENNALTVTPLPCHSTTWRAPEAAPAMTWRAPEAKPPKKETTKEEEPEPPKENSLTSEESKKNSLIDAHVQVDADSTLSKTTKEQPEESPTEQQLATAPSEDTTTALDEFDEDDTQVVEDDATTVLDEGDEDDTQVVEGDDDDSQVKNVRSALSLVQNFYSNRHSPTKPKSSHQSSNNIAEKREDDDDGASSSGSSSSSSSGSDDDDDETTAVDDGIDNSLRLDALRKIPSQIFATRMKHAESTREEQLKGHRSLFLDAPLGVYYRGGGEEEQPEKEEAKQMQQSMPNIHIVMQPELGPSGERRFIVEV